MTIRVQGTQHKWLLNGQREQLEKLSVRIRYFAIPPAMKISFRTRDKNKFNIRSHTLTFTRIHTHVPKRNMCCSGYDTSNADDLFKRYLYVIHEGWYVCVRCTHKSCGYKWLLYLVDLRLFGFLVLCVISNVPICILKCRVSQRMNEWNRANFKLK